MEASKPREASDIVAYLLEQVVRKNVTVDEVKRLLRAIAAYKAAVEVGKSAGQGVPGEGEERG